MSKPKIGYRVEIRVRRGVLCRSQGHKIWDVLEYCFQDATTACMSEAKAIALWEKLRDTAFPRKGGAK